MKKKKTCFKCKVLKKHRDGTGYCPVHELMIDNGYKGECYADQCEYYDKK